jgi:hypothetical protein
VALEVGAELGTIRVRKTDPEPYLKLKLGLGIEVCLDNLVPILQWLDVNRDWNKRILGSFSEPPPDLEFLIKLPA